MEVSLTIPTNWEEITIGQFSELAKLEELELDGLELKINLISILSGEHIDTIEKLSIKDINHIYSKLSFFLNEDIPNKIKKEISIDGIKYVSDLDIKKITAGQYIDLKVLLKDKKNIKYNIHDIMSLFYIPKGKKYDEIPRDEVANIFYNKMPITIAHNTAVFFCLLYHKSISNIKDYLMLQTKQKMREAIDLIKE